jgi:thiamine-phosphate diphosphorylase
MRLPDPIGVYAILDAGVMAVADLPAAGATMAQAGIRVFQVRAKGMPAGAFAALVTAVRDALGSGPVLLVNDRVDVAATTPCDGVHLGDEDLPIVEARRILPAGAIVGYSTHSAAEAMSTRDADYIGVGPVFATATKPTDRPTLGFEGFRDACQAATLPVVAIGGIGLAAIPALRRAGASGIAMISGLLVPGAIATRAAAAVAAFDETSDSRRDPT